MYPIALNLSRIHILLVGTGEVASRRLKQLQEAGATQVTFFDDHLPEAHEIRQASILLVAGLDDETSAVLTSIARLQGVLVNVEDKPDLCDFYFTSFMERGDLMISVSTNGASPVLAQEVRAYLERLFGEEWSDIVSTIGKQRLEWKGQGMDNSAVAQRTRAFIASNQWLSEKAIPS